jgi:acetolactate synthase-1/2/3 large subunit
MNLGFNVGAHLAAADVVVVVESAVPWIPKTTKLRPDAKIVHIGADPLATRFPFREFEADLLITGDATAALTLLRDALAGAKANGVEVRRQAAATARADMQAAKARLVEQVKNQTPIHPAWLAHCLNALKSPDAIIVNELGLPASQLELEVPLSYIGSGLAGGLGMGLGAGLGAKLAAPEREVIAAVGDGSYMFGTPLSYHFVARAENLPTLTLIANNRAWNAVRQSTLDVYPGGHASKANVMPLVDLKPAPDYEKVIESCGGRGERVDAPDALMGALERGFAAIRSGTPALLNIRMQNRM